MSTKEYTPEQHAAVKRVLAVKETSYYEISLVEKTATGSEIKKAYRKLALIMHPDKNPAPKADEAFKRISDAFQVLSDEAQRKIYDQTGVDPRSRASAAGPSGFHSGGFPPGFSGFGRGGAFRAAPADDLFAQFFGGPTMGGGMGGMGAGGPFQFHFANGDTDDSFSQLFGGMPRARAQQRTARADNGEQGTKDQTYFQLIFIAIILVLPTLLSWSFGSSTPSQPNVRFQPKRPYTEERLTPKYKIPYYVNPKDTADLSSSKLRTLGKHAENQFISKTRTMCSREYSKKQQAMQDASGWFFTDEDAYNEAKNMALPHCDLLDEYGIRLQN